MTKGHSQVFGLDELLKLSIRQKPKFCWNLVFRLLNRLLTEFLQDLGQVEFLRLLVGWCLLKHVVLGQKLLTLGGRLHIIVV